MNKAHALINWENYPSINTPLNAANLNKLDSSVDVIDNRVVELDANKATKVEVNSLVADVSYDENTGIFTVTKKNGSKITIDTKLEKLAINFTYEPTTQQLVITLDDGTKQYIDLSALITQYEFMDTDTVSFLIDTNGKVSAIVKEGSIEEKHLEPNYLAKIKVEVAKGQSSAEAAALSEANAKASENNSKTYADNALNSATSSENSAKLSESWAIGETGTRTGEDADNSKYYAEQSSLYASNAKASETNSKTSEINSKNSEKNAETYEINAGNFANSASTSADTATIKARDASDSANTANDYALLAQSYAIGETGVRDNEDADNAKYFSEISHSYKEESKHYANSAKDSVEQIIKKLQMATFDVDGNGNLIYTDDTAYTFSVDNDGYLIWEVI